MPVVAKGEQYVFAMNLEEVAEFVGLQGTGHTPLPPEVLIEKWMLVLRAAQRLSRQLSPAQLAENVIPNRERSIRLLAHHVFRVERPARTGRGTRRTTADDRAVRTVGRGPREGPPERPGAEPDGARRQSRPAARIDTKNAVISKV